MTGPATASCGASAAKSPKATKLAEVGSRRGLSLHVLFESPKHVVLQRDAP